MNALAFPEPPDPIRITDTVSYVRPGYRFDNGVILTFGANNLALVQWQDEFGQRRQQMLGVEFLRKAKTPTSDGAGAS